MILKNEEQNVHRLLGPIWGLFDEICVCDTGSTDNTVAAVKRYGARVIERPWTGFGAARDAAFRLATARFCIWLDGDDAVDARDIVILRTILSSAPDNMAYFITLTNTHRDAAQRMMCDQLRVYPNLPGVRWVRRVHEQVIDSCGRVGCRFMKAPVTVNHLGYDLDEAAHRAKYERNLALIEEELKDTPDMITHFHYAQSLIGLGREKEALSVLDMLSKHKTGRMFEEAISTRSMALAANIMSQAAQKAGIAIMQEALSRTPDEDYIRVCLAERYAAAGKPEEARATLEPIFRYGNLKPSLMPYPMELIGHIARKVWDDTQ